MPSLSQEDLRAIAHTGPEAVFMTLESLLAFLRQQDGVIRQHEETIRRQAETIRQQQETIAAQSQEIGQLRARVKTLEARGAKDSHNSSQPPSSDGFEKKTTSQRGKSERKPGGQPGHEGHTLEFREKVDRVVVHAPERCAACGTDLANELPSGLIERGQVWDVPEIALEVVEHQAVSKQCPCCQAVNSRYLPEEILPVVRYGPNLKAISTYLQTYHLLPYARTSELMDDLFGAPLSEGTLWATIEDCADRLEDPVEAIRKAIIEATLAQFDETGVRIGGKLNWLHGATTETLVYYAIHPKRGQAAMEAIGILPLFGGDAIHDAWGSYWVYECRHGLCNAHHLRELTYLIERWGQAWAAEMKRLLKEMKAAVDQAKAAGERALSSERLAAFEAEYERILKEGDRANPPPVRLPGQKGRLKQTAARNLLDRLRRYRTETLRFAHDFRVPFDNNAAERDLRMMKVQQKVSGGFRSVRGAEAFCRIRSYVVSARKQGHNVLSALSQVFLGSPLNLVNIPG